MNRINNALDQAINESMNKEALYAIELEARSYATAIFRAINRATEIDERQAEKIKERIMQYLNEAE